MYRKIFTLAFLPLLAAGANPIQNSSFELGLTGVGTINYHKKAGAENWKPLTAEIDSTTAAHGKSSLKLTMPVPKMECEFSLPEIALPKAGKYTLSMYLKADRPGKVRLQLYYVESDGVKWDIKLKYVNVTTGWNRYSATWYFNGKGSVAIPNLILDDNPMTLWVDGVQLDEGDAPKPYAPAADVESAVSLEGDRDWIYAGKHTLRVHAANYTDIAKTVEVKLNESEADTAFRRNLAPVKMELAPHSAKTVPVDYNFNHYGISVFSGTVTDGKVNPAAFGVFAKLPDIKLDPEKDFMLGENEPPYTRFHRNVRFAAATIFQDTPEKRWELLRASGIRMCRYWLRWMQFEPEEGKISNFPHDDDIAIMKRAGIEPVVLLGDSSISTKKGHQNENWFIIKRSRQGKRTYLSSGSVRNFTRMEDWKKHVRDVVSRYKGTVRYFEIMNEPNLFFEPEEYMPYLKAAYETAKAVNPDCVIIGICATGDFSGNLGGFIEECAKLGAFKYCDAVSFHPYSAQLDSAAVPAQQQIKQVKAILKKYSAGKLPLWNSELYYIHSLKESTKIMQVPSSSRHRAQAVLPAANALRRYLIDQSNGLAHTLTLEAGQFQNPFYQPRLPVPENWKYHRPVPAPHMIAGNAFFRFTAGKKCLGPWVPLAGCNGALYENADGSQTAAVWAVEEDNMFRFSAESGVKAYDMFGNEIAATGTLTAKPVWFTGQNLKKNLALSPAETFAVRGIRAVGGDKMQLAVDVLNRSSEAQTVQAKPRGVKGKQSAVIPAGAAHTFFFPVTGFKKECAVIVSNEEKMQSVTLPVIPARKALKSGTEQVMPYGAFRVTALPEGLDFRIKVRDDKRGDYEAKTPWEGDGVELFIDSRPFTGLDKGIYNDHVFRVFANPATKSHKALLTTSTNLDSSAIRWNIKENGADFEVSILIPWKSLKMNAPATLAFDIAINDSDDNTRLSSIPWSGDSDNYRNRFNFGTLFIN